MLFSNYAFNSLVVKLNNRKGKIVMKKIISILVAIVMMFTIVACKKESNQVAGVDKSNPQQLQFMKSDLKLTQEQVMSQIKAEHLLENKGYLDSDEIITLIQLEGDALIDDYIENYSIKSKNVSAFANSEIGQKRINRIYAKQQKLISELTEKGLIISVEHQYTTIINAIAVKTTYGNFKKFATLNQVLGTYISDTYNLPKVANTDTSAIENIVDVYPTGIFNSSSVDYTGDNTAVAVLDSGFDCSHSVFSMQPNTPMISQEDVLDVLADTNAAKTTQGLEISDVYYSSKIPFVYDYADKDPDVFPYDSEHGTHVAGIIGGKDDVITGVAVNTQLVLLKVFPDLNEGAETDDILAALEDAVLLGVDAINMSLGSSCGFSREEDGNVINDVYDKINESGISLLTAASNSYSSGFGGEQGNTNMVTNPDSGTVGSPSTYVGALSVASISGTKSKYMIGNDSQVFFFKESNSITGDENDFFKELGILPGETKTYEYVTVPGVGLAVNYTTLGDLTGKIALVRRGDNTFEEKALNAKNAGAAACIIYNNVDGDIAMSMGKTDHIPTISISKDDGTILASKDTGTLTISYEYQAGPFMSDFSSWGPTPSLQLKPEITAHGGNITSAIPGGDYDQVSGTSMATPNLCGIVVLIRQYLKEKYPDLTMKEISVLANQLLMSTATIVKNEHNNPYSPRKQGAGLASLYNAVNTNAYLTVDGIDRTKLDLFDDPDRTGVYEMEFNVVNLSNKTVNYQLDLVGMTESVSTSDSNHVSETSKVLGGNTTYEVVSGGTLEGSRLSVNPNETAKLKVTYTLSDSDKKYIDSSFPYGMYVEGFVKLLNEDENSIDLNIPFLAFYGDWTEAPLFDKTYYEVESEAHDASIDYEDKIKADYYATTPYGSYYYNYIIPLGTYLYDIDTSMYDAIPASKDKIAISNTFGTIDGLATVYGGLLRCAKTMTFTITDKATGEIVGDVIVDYNAQKAHSNGGTPFPYYNFLELSSYQLGLVNNREYTFEMKGLLDYGDGGIKTNVRNSFSFDFVLDDEAPILKEVTYEKEYDKQLKKDRYYITMTIYDNQYVQSITPIAFTSSSNYTVLSKNPIPVYSEKGQDNKVRFEITEYLDNIYADELITSALSFSIDDYALNSNIYMCQLPGTKGDFKFTKDGTVDGSDLLILSMYEDEVVDLTKYLATADLTVDENKEYLKYLSWASSDENIAQVQDGLVRGLNPGRVTITVQEAMELKKAVLIINVKERVEPLEESKKTSKRYAANKSDNNIVDSVDDATISSIRFSYFDTLFAYSRAAQTSEIGETGSRIFLSSLNGISFYPGEKIQLAHDIEPWYVADKYKLTYTSTNPNVAEVDENGVVTALKKGTTNIVLSVEGSNLMARVKVTVKSEFIIENRTLIAYKGLGGEVVIPDDEGILYIGAFAFCLYETDYTIDLPEDDYDANKIPSANTTIKSVIIPDGVEEIQKYAFYNCSGLEKVVIPDSVKYIREYAFYDDVKLTDINLDKVQTIGKYAFYNCELLNNLSMKKIYAIGANAFENCKSLSEIDLTTLRNSGKEIFKNCTSLSKVILANNTKLSYAMFVESGVEEIEIYEKVEIPAFCFAKCANLEKVIVHNDLVNVGYGAFSECPSLIEITFNGKVENFGEQVFYATKNLNKITLPNSEFRLGNYCFYQCEALEEVVFQENTKILENFGAIFQDTKVSKFTVHEDNPYYEIEDNYLVNENKNTIIFALPSMEVETLTIDPKYATIGAGAFSGLKIKHLVITNKDTVIEGYAFANCETLETITLPLESGLVIKEHAFNHTKALAEIVNLDKVLTVGDYAFANSGVKNITVGANAAYSEGAFYQSKVETITIGANATFDFGAFQNCENLKTVNMPEEGNVHFGRGCFAYCANLEEIDLTKIDEIIEEETFYGCANLKIANLANVIEVGNYAFSDCASLLFLSLPKVKKIGEGAFSRYDENGGAPQIIELNLPNTLVEIGDGAFIGCESLTEVVIPSSVEKVGDYLFAYCLNLGKVVLPSNIKYVGLYSFAGCKVLTNINLENVEVIADYAFTSSEILENIDLTAVQSIGDGAFAGTLVRGDIVSNNLTTIGDYAFQNTNLSSFTAPKLEYIGEYSFQNNSNLKEFVFSKKLTEIKLGAFYGCGSIENFYYIENNEKTLTGTINEYALLNDGVLYTTLENGKIQLASVPGGKDISVLEVLEGIVKIEGFAGNENKKINKIILPDSLKLIGNYAFYGYDELKEVEFKSFIAPALEDSYNPDLTIVPGDPGYEILHKHFDLFGLELYYCTFIDLVGKKEPIKMTLPANQDIEGYDSLVYEVYFGKVENASRSTYEAMHKNMINFIEYAKEIKNLSFVTLNNEKLINDAVTAYNSIKQNPTSYGYTSEEWNDMVDVVLAAKKVLFDLKLSNASLIVQTLQSDINALPDAFNINDLGILKAISERIKDLQPEDKILLDLTKYNKLVSEYENYCASLETEINPIINAVDKSVVYITISVISATSLLTLAILVIKKGLLK